MTIDIFKYEYLVKSIVKKYNFHSNYDDLYQAGMMGLAIAIKKYDMSKESSFTDYAALYIKGEILKSLNGDYQVKVSSDTYRLNKEINDIRNSLLQKLGRNPTTLELAYVMGESEDKIISVMNAFKNTYSLDNNYLDDDYNLYNKIALIEKGYDSGLLDLKEALKSLEESEFELITSRYYQDMTQDEIAKTLGISQVQVSRKETKILKKLRAKMI